MLSGLYFIVDDDTWKEQSGWLKILLFYSPNYRLNEINTATNLAQTKDIKTSITAIKYINL